MVGEGAEGAVEGAHSDAQLEGIDWSKRHWKRTAPADCHHDCPNRRHTRPPRPIRRRLHTPLLPRGSSKHDLHPIPLFPTVARLREVAALEVVENDHDCRPCG